MNQGYGTITVSRQFGAGGRVFCLELARHLDLLLFERELLSRLALEMKTSEEIVETYEKMRYGTQEYVLATFSKRYPFLEREIIESKKYIASMKKVMLKLTSLGKTILVGRGGQCILGDQPGCLHLRIVADRSYRLHRLAGLEQYAGYSQKKLERLIREMDAYRAEFTKKHFGRHIGDATLYHMVINFSLLTPQKALPLVIGLFRGDQRLLSQAP